MSPPDSTKGGPRAESRPTRTNPNLIPNPKEDFGPPTVPRQAPPGHAVELLTELLTTLDEIDDHPRPDARAYCDGYAAGYRAGYKIGHSQATHQAAQAQHAAERGAA